jgi:Flp pilus assembly protein TadG
VFAIGVGNDINVTEIQLIASAPNATHVFLTQFTGLLQSQIAEIIAVESGCGAATTTTTTTTSTFTTTSTVTTTTTTSTSTLTSTVTTTTTSTSTFTSTATATTTTSLCANYAPIDFIFVLDSSGSLGADNWLLEKQFAAQIVGFLPVGEMQSRFVH